jgi:hypothetical protein
MMNPLKIERRGRCAGVGTRPKDDYTWAQPLRTEPGVFQAPSVARGEYIHAECAVCGSVDPCEPGEGGAKVVGEHEMIVAARSRGFDFPRSELSAALDRVKNKKNWKSRINRIVTFKSERERVAVEEAVVFFCGCVAEMYDMGDGRTRVVADGYYAAVGA